MGGGERWDKISGLALLTAVFLLNLISHITTWQFSHHLNTHLKDASIRSIMQSNLKQESDVLESQQMGFESSFSSESIRFYQKKIR